MNSAAVYTKIQIDRWLRERPAADRGVRAGLESEPRADGVEQGRHPALEGDDDDAPREHLLHRLEIARGLEEGHEVVVGDDVVGDVGHERRLELAALDVGKHRFGLAAQHFSGLVWSIEALRGHVLESLY